MLIVSFPSRNRVSESRSSSLVDSKCRDMTAPYVRIQKEEQPDIELCSYFEVFEVFSLRFYFVHTESLWQTFERGGHEVRLNGVYSLDDLRRVGEENHFCPYFLARHLLEYANVVVYSYQYILHPKIRYFLFLFLLPLN